MPRPRLWFQVPPPCAGSPAHPILIGLHQQRRNQPQARLLMGKYPGHARPSFQLVALSLQHIRRAHAFPIRVRQRISSEDLFAVLFAVPRIVGLIGLRAQKTAQLGFKTCSPCAEPVRGENPLRPALPAIPPKPQYPVPCESPSLLIERRRMPVEIPEAPVQAAMPAFIQSGTGIVRMWPPLPTRSAMPQCSSLCWMSSTLNAVNSARRSPHLSSIASVA